MARQTPPPEKIVAEFHSVCDDNHRLRNELAKLEMPTKLVARIIKRMVDNGLESKLPPEFEADFKIIKTVLKL